MEAILGEWQKRYISDHICGVIRHTERSDAAFALDREGAALRWRESEDAHRWPHDPPLSEEGLTSAKDLGKTVRSFAEESGSKIDVVVCSPYTRCMQTGAVICGVLGKGTHVLVDESLGEIYGPSVMGPTEPGRCARPFKELPPQGISRSILSHPPKTVGRWPVWPEDVRLARRRFANRFLTYLKRSIATRRNFLLVTHADCVGAALSVLPGFAEQVLERIEYGGMLLGRRQAAGGAGTFFRSALGNLFSVDDNEKEHNENDEIDAPGNDDVEAPEVPEGWRIVTHGLTLHKIQDSEQAAFDRRTRALSRHSNFTQEQIRRLLGPLGAQTLDADVHEGHVSESTLIFGESAPTYSWSQRTNDRDVSNSARVSNSTGAAPGAFGDTVEGRPVGRWPQSAGPLAQASTEKAASSSCGGAAASQCTDYPIKVFRSEKARELLSAIRESQKGGNHVDNVPTLQPIQPAQPMQNGDIPDEAMSESLEPAKPKSPAMIINSIPNLSLLKRRGLNDIREL